MYLHRYHRVTFSIHLRTQRLGQSSYLLLEQVLSLGPHPRSGAVLQLKETGQESLAEHLRALTGEEGGQVVDADHAQGRALGARGQCDRHSRLVEGGGDVVDGDWVVGICSVKQLTLAQPKTIICYIEPLTCRR